MKTILAIALGGALGSVLRYGVNIGAFRLFGEGFPWGTLFVNVVGSFAIGLLTGLFTMYWQPSNDMKLFLVTGFLGGFTTFSAFSLDFANLWHTGNITAAFIYVTASVALPIAALFFALWLTRVLPA